MTEGSAPTPNGPQLNDVNWSAMSDDDVRKLAEIVGIDLSSAQLLHDDGKITDEELRWVYSDAEGVRNEMIRRDIRIEEAVYFTDEFVQRVLDMQARREEHDGGAA